MKYCPVNMPSRTCLFSYNTPLGMMKVVGLSAIILSSLTMAHAQKITFDTSKISQAPVGETNQSPTSLLTPRKSPITPQTPSVNNVNQEDTDKNTAKDKEQEKKDKEIESLLSELAQPVAPVSNQPATKETVQVPKNISQETRSPVPPPQGVKQVTEKGIQTDKVAILQKGTITKRPIKTISEDSFGLLKTTADTLTLWNNTPYNQLVDVVNKTTLSITSPTLYDIAQRALLANTPAPKLTAGHTTGDYLLARVNLFSRLGHLQKAEDLLTQSPLGSRPEFLQNRLTLALLSQDIPNACDLSSKILQRESTQGEDIQNNTPSPQGNTNALLTQKIDILCQSIAGYTDSALLRAEALMETTDAVSYLFLDTVDYLGGGPAPAPSALTQITPFTLLLARITGMEITKPILEQASPDVLYSAAKHPNITPSALVFALEHLARTGAISGTELFEGYNRIPFDKSQIIDPAGSLHTLPRPLQRALLARSTGQSDGWQHAVSLLKRADTPEDAIMISNMVAPVLAQLTPSVAYQEHAPLIARTLLLAGNGPQAKVWYDQRNLFVAPIKYELATLYPALLANDAKITEIFLHNPETMIWVNDMRAYSIQGVKALVRGITLLNALGFDVDKQLWYQIDAPFFPALETTTQLPSSGLLLLEKLSGTGIYTPDSQFDSKIQRGMTALFTINLIGKTNAHTLSDNQASRVIKALYNTFGQTVARAYTKEALIKVY